jgi:hypothetical protein
VAVHFEMIFEGKLLLPIDNFSAISTLLLRHGAPEKYNMQQERNRTVA